MPQKLYAFEAELPSADYGDIIRLNKVGDYGTLDNYMAVGTDQYKWADGLYVKVAGINVTPIYMFLRYRVSLFSNPDLRKRKHEPLITKAFDYLCDKQDKP